MLRIRDVYPGSPDPDFYPFLPIPDPTTATTEKGEHFFVVLISLVATSITQLKIILFALEEQIFCQFIKNNKKTIPDPGVKKAPDPGRIRNTAYR